jgi:quinol monooxygenase YgiN
MAFIQTIEMSTSKVDDLRALEKEWRAATEGKRTLRRSIIAQDRNDPTKYVIIAFFDSYESAMQNSQLPATSEFAERQRALIDGEPAFRDLDVIEDQAE